MICIDPKFDMALVQMTNRCNITCRHCYVSSHPHGQLGFSREALFQLVEALELVGIGRLALSGGEPLSRADDALATLWHAKSRLDLLLLTNGMLISDRVAKALTEIAPVVRISLDGATAAVHDRMRGPLSFARTMRGINRLLDAGFDPKNLEFFATLPDDAVHQVPEILCVAEDLGVQRVKFEPVCRTGRAAESWGPHEFNGDDPATRGFRAAFDNFTRTAGNSRWKIGEIVDTAFRVLTIYENGEVYPYTWTDERDREVGFLGTLQHSGLCEILDPTRVSLAIMSKFVMMAQGPQRSLRALRVTRRFEAEET